MAEETGIAWCDSTFNAWWGCVKVGPECLHCYAETLDAATGGNHWGVRSLPRKMSSSNWRNPRVWNREHEAFFDTHGRKRRVFCGSMMDWCDKNSPEGQRDRLWTLIKETPNLTWQMLTKRSPNIMKYLPSDWGDGYENVWLGVSVGNKKHGLKRIEDLRKVPAKVRFLSIEPLLEDLGQINLNGIHWVIVGGESGEGFRKMDPQWALNIKRQCEEQGVSFFFKQNGGFDGGDDIINGEVIKQWPILFKEKYDA
jgi:protein gp37